MTEITQERLKELIHYDPETGGFNWVVNRGSAKKGHNAGCTSKRGYCSIKIDNKIHLSHRIAFLYMEGEFPLGEVDHINHIKDDNRWSNLRDATHTNNQMNRSLNKNNSSGCVGVYWQKRIEKWRAHIKVSGVSKHLGYFSNLSDAVSAREEANIKYGFHENHGHV